MDAVRRQLVTQLTDHHVLLREHLPHVDKLGGALDARRCVGTCSVELVRELGVGILRDRQSAITTRRGDDIR
jgi:hypothetical protein